MKITSVQIRNFRGIKSLDLELGETTVLVGENNTGKTSVMDALRMCLEDIEPRNRIVFDALDFHLPTDSSEPTSTDPIEITVTFSERFKGEWGIKIERLVGEYRIIQWQLGDIKTIQLHLQCFYDSYNSEFVQTWSFIDQNGNKSDDIPRFVFAEFSQLFQYYYLGALRDAAQHFDESGPFWKPFLINSQLSKKNREEIESKLVEINDLIVASHASFENVMVRLRELQSLVLLAQDDVVSVDAVPSRMFDILSRAQVQIRSKTGAMIPLVRHGEGTQSLSVLMLFSAFFDSHSKSTIFLALEEPEAHLHPSAIRILWKILQTYANQRLISTHSGELLAEVDIHDIRRLSQSSDGIKVHQVPLGLLSREESRKFNSHIRRAQSGLLYARCWLLVEGETESWIYPSAALALGWNLHDEGIRIVEYQQSDIAMLAKIGDALGILWYCVGDDDENRKKVEKKLLPIISDRDLNEKMEFPYPNIETNLLQHGYDQVYAQYVTDLRLPKKSSDESGYWEEYAKSIPKRSKTKAAADVAVLMEDQGEAGVPPQIRFVLEKLRHISQGG
ncbi:MAG: DUF2813 domain-containing protein [Bacteroidetes bacterium]|nr:DUF2813 domain-containing protein [Bacteroidota bacterium]